MDWLNETLYLFERDEVIFAEMVLSLAETVAGFSLKARLLGNRWRMEEGKKGTEVKAATYHELRVVKDKTGWQATITLDL